ncbi:MAG TPA: hypothetical protein VHQ65_00050 [Thermoanaerobaculia bacterium]|nr:hypothetical protein [Thermoanaerobaculia bacterium]
MKRTLRIAILSLALAGGAFVGFFGGTAQAAPGNCPLVCCEDGSACIHCCPGKPCKLVCGL